jgi:hypothetical protein
VTRAKINARLRGFAKQYGANTLRRWRHDEPLAWVMSLADYVHTFGTDRGYRAFVRIDEAMLFVQLLPRVPRWLDQEVSNA